MEKIKASSVFFYLNFVLYFLVAANMRSVAQANYIATAVTDIVTAIVSFTIVEKIGSKTDKNWYDKIAYALGGTIGALIAIWLTKEIFGQ